jgi:uncharacterized protein (TIGR02996 family)
MSHAAFLEGIRLSPEDDTARLVYADFLDEQPGPADAARAEFIRTQIELNRLPEISPERPAREDRENELLRTHERQWLGKLSDPLAKGLTRWQFERGFVSKIAIDTRTLRQHGTTLFARHPITAVRVDSPTASDPGPVATLARREWWSRVLDLRLGENVSSPLDACELLLTSPRLTALLRLSVCVREQRGLNSGLPDILARCASLPVLEELSVSDWPHDPALLLPALNASGARTLRVSGGAYTASGLAQLLSSEFAGRLGRVELADGNLSGRLWPALGRKGVRPILGRLSFTSVGRNTNFDLPTLLSSPAAAKLDALDLGETNLSGTKVRVLASSGFLGRASEIGLTRCHINAKVMAVLARERAPHLRTLKLGETGLHTAGVMALCSADWCDNLTHLDIMRNHLSDEALSEMANSGRFRNLRHLDLRVNSPDLGPGCTDEIGDRGLTALAGAANLARLRHLNLYRTRVTAKGVEALLNSPHWQITELELGGYDLGPDLVRVLATSPRLARFTRLGLSFTPALGGDALLPLAESPYLSPLCHLDVRYNNTSDRVRSVLARRLGRRLNDYPPVGTW